MKNIESNPLEDSEGRIKNPEVGHEMAKAEAPYHNKGVAKTIRDAAHAVFPEHVQSSEQKAAAAIQEVGDEYLKTGVQISEADVPAHLRDVIKGAIGRAYNGAMDTGSFGIAGWYFVSYDGNPDRKNGRYIVRGTVDYHSEYGQPVSRQSKSYAFEVTDGRILSNYYGHRS